MQKLCKNYAKITQKKLRKNYAYVCKLHNLYYYAPPTLLMVHYIVQYVLYRNYSLDITILL